MKRCSDCKKNLPETEFSYSNGQLRPKCNPCYRDYQRQYYAQNTNKSKKPLMEFLLANWLPHTKAFYSFMGVMADGTAEFYIRSFPTEQDFCFVEISSGNNDTGLVTYKTMTSFCSLLYHLGIRELRPWTNATESVEYTPPAKNFFDERKVWKPLPVSEVRAKFLSGMTDFERLELFFKINHQLIKLVHDRENWQADLEAKKSANLKIAQQFKEKHKYGD